MLLSWSKCTTFRQNFSSEYCISWCFILHTLSASMFYGQYFEIGHGKFLFKPFHLAIYNMLFTYPAINDSSWQRGLEWLTMWLRHLFLCVLVFLALAPSCVFSIFLAFSCSLFYSILSCSISSVQIIALYLLYERQLLFWETVCVDITASTEHWQ